MMESIIFPVCFPAFQIDFRTFFQLFFWFFSHFSSFFDLILHIFLSSKNHAVPIWNLHGFLFVFKQGTSLIRLNIIFRCICFLFKEVIKNFLFIIRKVCTSPVSVFTKFYFNYIFNASRSCGHYHDTVC